MKRFHELFRKSPRLPRDEAVLSLCRSHPDEVPIAVLIGQYNGAEIESEKKMLYQILADIVTDDVMKEEVY